MARKLPKGWERKSLGGIAKFRGGTAFPEKEQGARSGDYPFIKVSDLDREGNERSIVGSENWIAKSQLKKLRATAHPKGAVVFAKVGAALRLNRRRMLNQETVIDNNLMSAEAKAGISSDYLYHWLCALDLGRHAQDGGVPSVNQSILEEILIDSPPLKEQRRIVCVLNAADRLITLDERLLAQREARYQSLLQTVLRPVEQQRAKGWRRVHLGDIFGERDKRSGELPLLAITGEHGVVPRDELERRDTSAEDKSNYKVIRKGDIGYNTMRMWQGVFGLSAYDGIVSPAYTVVTPDRVRILGEFAAHLFSHPRVVHTFHRYSQGLVDDTLQLKYPHFSEIRLPIPDISEQRRIAKALDAQLREVEQMRRLVELRRQQHRGLMQQLLTGRQRFTRDLPGMEAADG